MGCSRIAEERKKLGYSQEELANRLKISQKSISKYECGTRRPSYETLLAMSSLFEVSTDYLLGKSDAPGGQPQGDAGQASEAERRLLELYREYEEKGYTDEIASGLREVFPEMGQGDGLGPSGGKMLAAFGKLDEDNRDIIIGKAKELLKEQARDASPSEGGGLELAAGT